jgi:hypothetical protein
MGLMKLLRHLNLKPNKSMKTITNTEKTIKIPAFLHELHGEVSSRRDIAITHLAAWGLTGLTAWLSVNAGYPLWITILLAVLMVDIAGGVVSNFTKGTNNFYAAHPRKRIIFLLLHVIQPGLLAIMFPEYAFMILGVMAYTLPISFWIDDMKNPETRRTIGPFFAILGITGVLMLPISFAGLQLILMLYIIKLVLAFSVDWYGNKE